jgi:hypothetical protein
VDVEMGLADCFAHFGAATKNSRWSWSARSRDGKVVVMTLWQDLLNYRVNPIAYDTFGRADLPEWTDTPGNRERLENLKWARDHCDGLFRVVIAVAKDTKASPRTIARCFPQDRMVMKLIDLNEQTGEFRAVNVGTTSPKGERA